MPRETFSINEWSTRMSDFNFGEENEQGNTQEGVNMPVFTPALMDNKSVQGVFVTKFTPADVEDFRKILQENPPQRFQSTAQQNLGALLKKAIKEWMKKNPNCECFVEPFLWALKETDPYIGSIAFGNLMPQPWIVSAIGSVLHEFWKDNAPEFNDVLRNVLLNWDWYQPLHIMMDVYSRLKRFQEEEIEKKLREYWLYRIYYSNAVIDCLCAKPRSKENIQALISFVCKNKQQDKLQPATTIEISKKMREKVIEYLNTASDDDFKYAKEYYKQIQDVSRKARQEFGRLFSINPTTNIDVEQHVTDWAEVSADNTKKLQELEEILLYYLDDRNSNVLLIEAATRVPLLTNKIVTYYKGQPLAFRTQFALRAMAGKSANVPEYKQYLEQRYQTEGQRLDSPSAVMIGCAYCLSGHRELVEPLTRKVFLDGLGKDCKRIFIDIMIRFSEDYANAVDKIRAECLNNIQQACKLLDNCAAFYDKTPMDRTRYPVAFDQVCRYMKKCSNCSGTTVISKKRSNTVIH